MGAGCWVLLVAQPCRQTAQAASCGPALFGHCCVLHRTAATLKVHDSSTPQSVAPFCTARRLSSSCCRILPHGAILLRPGLFDEDCFFGSSRRGSGCDTSVQERTSQNGGRASSYDPMVQQWQTPQTSGPVRLSQDLSNVRSKEGNRTPSRRTIKAAERPRY